MASKTLENIDLDLLRHYLEKSGWERSRSNYDSLDIFVAPEKDDRDQEIEVIIPNVTNIPGEGTYLRDAIKTIAVLNGNDFSHTLEVVKNLDFDLHNYRLKGSSNSISLNLLKSLLEAKKPALEQAVQIEQKVFYYGLSQSQREKYETPTDKAEHFVEMCRFPHTWSGSFGLTVELPLEQLSLGLFNEQEISETLGRKTSYRFFKGFELFRTAFEKKSKNYVLDHIEKEDDIAFFKYFQDLLGAIKNNTFDFNINMSPTMRGSSYEEVNNRTIPIDKNTIRYVRHTFEQLDEPEEKDGITFIGFPTTLKSDRESLLKDLLASDRKVTVTGDSSEINARTLKLSLSLSDYKKALRAQEENLTVKVICDVVEAERGWDVKEVIEFMLLD